MFQKTSICSFSFRMIKVQSKTVHESFPSYQTKYEIRNYTSQFVTQTQYNHTAYTLAVAPLDPKTAVYTFRCIGHDSVCAIFVH